MLVAQLALLLNVAYVLTLRLDGIDNLFNLGPFNLHVRDCFLLLGFWVRLIYALVIVFFPPVLNVLEGVLDRFLPLLSV